MSDKLLPCKLCGSEARPVTLEDRWTWCTGGKCEMYDQEIRVEIWNALMDTNPSKGYVLVPVEPTTDMRDEAVDSLQKSLQCDDGFDATGYDCYKAMIAAAPEGK